MPDVYFQGGLNRLLRADADTNVLDENLLFFMLMLFNSSFSFK